MIYMIQRLDVVARKDNMKIRQGFVSNSSSSSFIVSFPKGFVPTKEAVKDYLFKGIDSIQEYGDPISTDDMAEIICRDMLEQTPNDEQSLIEELGGSRGGPRFEAFKLKSDSRNFDWEAYDAARKAYASGLFESRYDLAQEDLYIFSYSDNDGDPYTTMEHGGIFDSVKSVRFSHH